MNFNPMKFNKVCELEDFADEELVGYIREVCAQKAAHFPAEYPAGYEARKDWEVAMSVRALRHFGALNPDAVILGVAAGTEDTIFYLTRHARQVFVTDRYLGAGAWGQVAPVAMLVDPAFLAPFDFDPNRLVVQHMDGRSLRYPDETFDAVFSSGSIEHFGELLDVAHAAYEMGRVLKPGGILALSTEFKIEGPPEGIGWPGDALMLSAENLRRYIVEASGLEPVDDLETVLSEPTLATARDISQAVIDHDRRLNGAGARGVPEYALWDFPHVVMSHGGYEFTSVHLTLRRPAAWPAVDNAWARPPRETLDSIASWNAGVLAAGDPSASSAAEPEPAGPVPAPTASVTDDDDNEVEAEPVLPPIPVSAATGMQLCVEDDDMLEQLAEFRPTHLTAYASVLHELARATEDGKLDLKPELKQVVNISERLMPQAREHYEKIFGAPVLDDYGMGECLFLTNGCAETGGMHVNADWAISKSSTRTISRCPLAKKARRCSSRTWRITCSRSFATKSATSW